MSIFLNKSGYEAPPFDPRDVWEDELLAGDSAPDPELPPHYRVNSFKFEPQGAYPFCVSFATTALAEQIFKTRKSEQEFSQKHLFYHSAGTRNGSNFKVNLETARQFGCVPSQVCPMPKNIWEISDESFAAENKAAQAVNFVGAKKIPGYVRINPTPNQLKAAIIKYGGLLTGVAASGGYWSNATKRPEGKEDNHAVVLAGWDDDGSWWIFDSLQPTTAFDGYHKLHPSYDFHVAYGITALPEDWKELRDEARVSPPNNAARYGKPRDFAAEVAFADKMMKEFAKFNNKSVLDAAGRFWEQLIRAGVYGGYSLSYTKWGVWQPGDLINFVYAWRRTGQYIFNLDKERNNQ